MIYLDHHAAAPMSRAVREAMDEAAGRAWANPSSAHAAGRASSRLVESGRERVADAIGASAADLVLTRGGTEACNLGVRGLAPGCERAVTSQIEHPAVARSVDRLGRDGLHVVELPVLHGTPPTPEELGEHVGPSTVVAVQWINHETGTAFPVHDYARVCRSRGARLFVDATQALGKVLIDVEELGADAVALAAHKIGGPAGAGACWVRRGLDVEPVLDGGAQERGRHPGTVDAASAVGFGAACDAVPERLQAQPRIQALRDRLEGALVELGAVVNAGEPRAATVSNLSFRTWKAPLLVAALDLEGVCVSAGAACSSGLDAPSAVIGAMYPDAQWRAGSAIRISLGIETTEAEIETALGAFARVVPRAGAKNLNQI